MHRYWWRYQMSGKTTLCHFRWLLPVSVFGSLLYLTIFLDIIVAKLESYVKFLNSFFINNEKGDDIFSCRCSEIVLLFCFFEYVRVERTWCTSNVLTPLRRNWTGNVVRMRLWLSVRSTILVTCEYFREAYYCNKFWRISGFITDFETFCLTLTLKYSIGEGILYTTAWNCFTWRPPAGLLDIAR